MGSLYQVLLTFEAPEWTISNAKCLLCEHDIPAPEKCTEHLKVHFEDSHPVSKKVTKGKIKVSAEIKTEPFLDNEKVETVTSNSESNILTRRSTRVRKKSKRLLDAATAQEKIVNDVNYLSSSTTSDLQAIESADIFTSEVNEKLPVSDLLKVITDVTAITKDESVDNVTVDNVSPIADVTGNTSDPSTVVSPIAVCDSAIVSSMIDDDFADDTQSSADSDLEVLSTKIQKEKKKSEKVECSSSPKKKIKSNKNNQKVKKMKKIKKTEMTGSVSHNAHVPFFTCSRCKWKSGRHYNYHRHVLTHWELTTVPVCEYCDKRLEESSIKDRLVQCTRCEGKPYIYPRSFAAHMLKIHNCKVHARTSKKEGKSKIFPEKEIKLEIPGRHIQKGLGEYMCEHCSFIAKRSDVFLRHQLVEHPQEDQETYACNDCDFVTRVKTSLLRHRRIHRHQYTCQSCDLKLGSITALLDHMTKIHPDVNISCICKICGLPLGSEQELREHAVRHESGMVYECDKCEFFTMNKGALANHQSQHQDYANDTNQNSGEKITKRRKRKASVMQESMEPYKCQHCSEEFDVLSLLNEHLKEKHEVANVRQQCLLCGFVSVTKHAAIQHRRQVCQRRSCYKCDQCDFTTDRLWNLQRHKESHTAGFGCTLCDYVALYPGHLAQHYTKIHMVPCPEGIVRRTNRPTVKRDVNAIVRPKKKEMKFACEICGETIAKAQMITHMDKHNGIHRFRCHFDDCLFQTRSSYSLSSHIKRKHLRTYQNKKLYCRICTFSTQYKDRLQNHMDTKHIKVSRESVIPGNEQETAHTSPNENTASSWKIEQYTDIDPATVVNLEYDFVKAEPILEPAPKQSQLIEAPPSDHPQMMLTQLHDSAESQVIKCPSSDQPQIMLTQEKNNAHVIEPMSDGSQVIEGPPGDQSQILLTPAQDHTHYLQPTSDDMSEVSRVMLDGITPSMIGMEMTNAKLSPAMTQVLNIGGNSSLPQDVFSLVQTPMDDQHSLVDHSCMLDVTPYEAACSSPDPGFTRTIPYNMEPLLTVSGSGLQNIDKTLMMNSGIHFQEIPEDQSGICSSLLENKDGVTHIIIQDQTMYPSPST